MAKKIILKKLILLTIFMSIKITYFVHGTTTDNEQNISSGWSDVELSDLEKLSEYLMMPLLFSLKYINI